MVEGTDEQVTDLLPVQLERSIIHGGGPDCCLDGVSNINGDSSTPSAQPVTSVQRVSRDSQDAVHVFCLPVCLRDHCDVTTVNADVGSQLLDSGSVEDVQRRNAG